MRGIVPVDESGRDDPNADGRHGYVTNYSMYGQGFSGEGSDVCSPSSGHSRSTVYRVDTESLRIDRAALEYARSRWSEARKAGHEVTYWQQDEDGRWVKRA